MAPHSTPDRGVSPAVGVVLLAGLTVVLAGGVAAVSLAVGPPSPSAADGPTVLSATATADGRVTLRHRGGAPLSVPDLRLRITVDGTPLRHQPPVPFVGARGFRGAPSGPFNRAGDTRWTAGERAGVVVAGTNSPALTRGSTVGVTVYENDRRVAAVETTVQASASSVSGSSPSRSSLGTRATVVIARGVPGLRCWMWCSNSVNPASENIRSASASS